MIYFQRGTPPVRMYIRSHWTFAPYLHPFHHQWQYFPPNTPRFDTHYCNDAKIFFYADCFSVCKYLMQMWLLLGGVKFWNRGKYKYLTVKKREIHIFSLENFPIESVVVVTVYPLIMNQIKFPLVHDRGENCHCDHTHSCFLWAWISVSFNIEGMSVDCGCICNLSFDSKP